MSPVNSSARFLAVALVLGSFIPQEPPAAQFEASLLGPGKGSLITINGDLALGDEKKFIDLALTNPEAIVAFRSDGGNLKAGIEIGKAIRLKGYATLVPNGMRCTSACALAWLGGGVRFMSQSALVGFHAAFRGTDGQVTSAGNALIGAYLNQLGLPAAAIIYITEPSPNEMRWLTFADAQKVGIEVKQLELPDTAPISSKAEQPTRATQGAATRPDQTQVFVDYFWKNLNQSASATDLASFYSQQVQYHGKTVTRSDVVADKAAFFVRWPRREYTRLPGSLSISCNGEICSASGTIYWEVSSDVRNATSTGYASFLLTVDWSTGHPVILGESSQVRSRKVGLLSSASEPTRSKSRQPSSARAGSAQFAAALLRHLILGDCQMEQCFWFSIEKKDLVDRNSDGELYELMVKHWQSTHPSGTYDKQAPRRGGEEGVEYVFCSKQYPGTAFPANGKVYAHLLSPERPGGIYGYNESSYVMYFAACHGIELKELQTAMPSIARGLGYNTSASRVRQEELQSPRALMGLK